MQKVSNSNWPQGTALCKYIRNTQCSIPMKHPKQNILNKRHIFQTSCVSLISKPFESQTAFHLSLSKNRGKNGRPRHRVKIRKKKKKNQTFFSLKAARQQTVQCVEFQPRAFQSETVIVWKDKCAFLFFLSQQSSTVEWNLFSGSLKCEKGLFGCSEVSHSRSLLLCEIARAFNIIHFRIQSFQEMAKKTGKEIRDMAHGSNLT